MRDFECGNVEATEGGEQTRWGSEGRCKHPSGVRGGAPEQKICELNEEKNITF